MKLARIGSRLTVMTLRRGLMVLLGFGLATGGYSFSATISIEELAAKSPVVVLARVVSIREVRSAHGTDKHAKAKVLEAWKGSSQGQHIEYIASPGWFLCDTSAARIGETIVLFLEQDEHSEKYRIAHFGRGRMKVGPVRGTLHAAIYEVTFPAGVVSKQPKYPYRDVVTLRDLKKLIAQRTRPIPAA